MSGRRSTEHRSEPGPTAFDPERLPILGEPLPIELANTTYRTDGTMIDFLATREMVDAWFAHAPAAATIALPDPLTDTVVTDLRELRDAIHALCAHVTSGECMAPAEFVNVLNRTAANATSHLRLDWVHDRSPTATLTHRGSPADVFLAQLASEAITFFVGPDRVLIRTCATPSCELFFVQRHHRRRFCSEPCSQRTRQSRYYRTHCAPSTHEARAGS
jgi:predicted RNA-binding Zn ribbon-like protein